MHQHYINSGTFLSDAGQPESKIALLGIYCLIDDIWDNTSIKVMLPLLMTLRLALRSSCGETST